MKKMMYLCFVDIEKVFNEVPRNDNGVSDKEESCPLKQTQTEIRNKPFA